MDLLPTAEQQGLVDATVDFLSNEFPADRLRKSASDHERWSRMAEMGWFGLLVPEIECGLGAGLAETALLFREFGRHLLPPGVLATVVAAAVAATDGKTSCATALLEGRSRAGLALFSPQTDLSRIANTSCTLIDAVSADVLIAWNENETVLLPASDIIRHPMASIDPRASIETARLARGSAPFVSVSGFKHVSDVLVAAMLTGIALQARDMAVEHAKNRQQFGHAIGSFQAIKHMCADMALKCEAAASLTTFAALIDRDDKVRAARLSSAAKVVALDAAYDACRGNIQIHGGMGFTEECLAHFYLKRVHVLEQIGGDLRHHLEQVIKPVMHMTSAHAA